MQSNDPLRGLSPPPGTAALRVRWNRLAIASICDLQTQCGDWFTRDVLFGFLLGAGVDPDVAAHVADNAPDGGWSVVDRPAPSNGGSTRCA